MTKQTFVRDRRRITQKEYLLYGLGVFLIVIGTLLYIWPNVKIVHISSEFSRLNSEKKALLQHNRVLRIESESLKSLESIESEALKNGYGFPVEGQMVYILTDFQD